MEPTLFANILGIIRRYRSRFLKATLMVLISNILIISNPLLLRHALLTFNEGSDIAFSKVLPWAIALLIIALTSAYFKYWMRMEFVDISRDVEKEVRTKLFGRMQEQSQAFYDKNGIGEILSRLSNDITAYRDLIGPGLMYPLFFLTLVVPGFFALLSISYQLTVIAFVPLLIIPVMNFILHKQIFRVAQKVQSFLGRMSSMTQEHYAGIRIVKSYDIEGRLQSLFNAMCAKFAILSIRYSCLQGMLFPLLTLFTRIITVLLVLFSGLIILYSLGNLSGADFVSFMWIQSYIFFPILMLAWLMPIYERGRAAYDRLYEIYHEPIEVKDNPSSELKLSKESDITFKNLSYSYPTSKYPVLHNLNLHIKPRSFVGLTGPVGAGKSTLFQILSREYEIPHGHLFIGDHEVHEYSLKALKEEIVMVEQRAFLFSKTVAENVKFGKEEASEEELELVSQYADLHDTVMNFPERYSTVVGERGATLSGGQKQRVAVARAFLVDRSILLLDDIFSAVDSATEKRIFRSIKEKYAGKTVIIITHRVSILEQMDRVIYLKDGQIKEDGTPEELKGKKGYFAALADLQKLTDGGP